MPRMTKPVEKHRFIIKKMLNNVGKNATEADILIRQGYSPAYARSGRIKTTKSWQALMEKHLPDELLTRMHQKLLTKKEVVVRNDETGKIVAFKTGEIDPQSVKAGLEMGYKLKNKFGDVVVRHKFGELSDAELEEQLAEEMAKLAIDGSK